MTKKEASTLLEEVLMALAKNSVHNQRLVEYADQLERYIYALEEKEKEESSKKAETEKTDDDAEAK